MAMDRRSESVEEFLAKSNIHQKWIETYYNAENEAFCEQEFDYVTQILNAPDNSIFLDAGCGNCAHSIRLANRGFFVQAIDFSEAVLKLARDNVKAKGLEDRIQIQHGNLLALPFDDAIFDYVLCCGVLMHIPDVERAISELARVLSPGGILVVSEGNMYSLETIILRNLKRLLRKGKAVIKKTPAGMEYWTKYSAGALMTRQANIRWLIERFGRERLSLKKRIAGQFTELYHRTSSAPLKKLIHAFNHFWFKYVRIPHPAFGNIVILQKDE